MTEPKLRFKRDDGTEFPAREEKKLGDMCEELKASINPQDYPDRLFVEYSMSAFDNNKLPSLMLGKSMNSNRKIMDKPCVLINKLNVRKNRIWLETNPPENAVCSAEFVPLASYKMDLRFLSFLALSSHFTSRLLNCSSGTSNSQKRVTPEIITGMILALPCLEEQQKIADFLSDLDAVISVSEAEVAALEQQKKGAMQKVFSQEVRFRRDDGTEYPAWKVITLGDRFVFKNGINASREAFRTGDIPCIGVSDIIKCLPIISKNIIGTVSISDGEIEKNKVDYGDILFQRSSETQIDIGHAAVYYDHVPSVYNGFVICAKPDRLFYNPIFMHYSLQNDTVRKQTVSLGAGAQHYNIGQEGLAKIKVILPCLEEQQKIAGFLSSFDEAISFARQELEKWKLLKKGLMQQMFV